MPGQGKNLSSNANTLTTVGQTNPPMYDAIMYVVAVIIFYLYLF